MTANKGRVLVGLAHRTTLASLIKDGSLDGYRNYAPRGLADGIDKEVAESNPCDHCGAMACFYRGFKNGESYRAFACCAACGAASEF